MRVSRFLRRIRTRFRTHRRRFLRSWALGIGLSLLVSMASFVGYFRASETRILDLFLSLRPAVSFPEVLLVTIDEAAFAALGQRQPVSRAYLAELIELLDRSGARVIGLDVDLTTPTAEDPTLYAAMRRAAEGGVSKVVLSFGLQPGQGAYRPQLRPDLPREVLAGFANFPADRYGTVRQMPPLAPTMEGTELPSFPVALLARYAGYDRARLAAALAGGSSPEPRSLALPEWDHRRGVVRAGTSVAIGREPAGRINFAGPAGTFRAFPSQPLAELARAGAPIADANPFRGKIVLVGGTFQAARDVHATPLGAMSGLELHANALYTLLTRGAIRPVNRLVVFGFQLSITFLASVFFILMRPLRAFVLSVICSRLVMVPLGYLVYATGNFWFDFVSTTLLVGLYSTLVQQEERKLIRHSFTQFLGKEVVDQIYRMGDEVSLTGGRREVTLLFSDLRGFTALTERLEPQALVRLLNQHFEAMTAVVFRHRGMINKFVGDAVMAVFNAPVSVPDHARRAVQTAVEMQQALEVLNREWAGQLGLEVAMGIGVHTGEVYAGNIGSKRRIEYTVIGDPVNVASRVQELTKPLGARILITEETLAHLGEMAEVKDQGVQEIRGRSHPVRVFEVLGMRSAR